MNRNVFVGWQIMCLKMDKYLLMNLSSIHKLWYCLCYTNRQINKKAGKNSHERHEKHQKHATYQAGNAILLTFSYLYLKPTYITPLFNFLLLFFCSKFISFFQQTRWQIWLSKNRIHHRPWTLRTTWKQAGNIPILAVWPPVEDVCSHNNSDEYKCWLNLHF